jgi:hypothetical protein
MLARHRGPARAEGEVNDTVTLLTDLEEFVADHRPHGAMTGDVTEPGGNGYLIMVVCPCGVTFERWVMPQDATVDLLREDLRAGWN